jgi:hypothetical protein
VRAPHGFLPDFAMKTIFAAAHESASGANQTCCDVRDPKRTLPGSNLTTYRLPVYTRYNPFSLPGRK